MGPWFSVGLTVTVRSDLSEAAYGESCARPLARRRFKTRRPALVAIRARNPWVLARLILLGWNVRFIAENLGYRRESGSRPKGSRQGYAGA